MQKALATVTPCAKLGTTQHVSCKDSIRYGVNKTKVGLQSFAPCATWKLARSYCQDQSGCSVSLMLVEEEDSLADYTIATMRMLRILPHQQQAVASTALLQ